MFLGWQWQLQREVSCIFSSIIVLLLWSLNTTWLEAIQHHMRQEVPLPDAGQPHKLAAFRLVF